MKKIAGFNKKWLIRWLLYSTILFVVGKTGELLTGSSFVSMTVPSVVIFFLIIVATEMTGGFSD